MKKLMIACVMAGAVMTVGCAHNGAKSEMTPLEIQSLQSREYEVNKKVVFASVVSVFQDLGYTVESADLETGLIRVQSAAKSSMASKILLGRSHVEQTAATAFIENVAGTTRLRLNFVSKTKTSSAYGMSDSSDEPILDAKTYQNAFEKIENAIFIRNAG